MQAPPPNTRPLRAPLRGTGMTRPNAAVALESAAKARAAMQTAQQRGSAAGGQPVAPAMQQAPQRGAQQAPAKPQPQVQPGRAPAQPAPVAYPNPEWNPRAMAAKQLQGLPVAPQVGPVALPVGMQPAAKPGGNPMASTAPAAKPGFEVPTGVPVVNALSDPSMWTDETDEFEADYGTQGEQQAGQQQSQEAQYAIDTYYGGDAMAYYQDQVDLAQTPEGKAAAEAALQDYVISLTDVDLDLPEFADMVPEGIWDTLTLAGKPEDEWANENNPGPGWSWNDATGKWTQEALPPGVSADDPRWNYNEEAGKWQLFDASGEENLVDRDYWDEKAKGALESDVEDYMNPELDAQKKEAWDQAQAANLDVAKALGSRGIGASGLVGMGMGDIFKATQNNVQGLEFDEYTRAAELRLNEIRTILSGRQGDLSAEMQKELADEAAKLEKEMAQMQYAREDRDDIWQQIDNIAADAEKKAPEGWASGSLNAFKKWASTPGNDPYKAVITLTPDGFIVFDQSASSKAMVEDPTPAPDSIMGPNFEGKLTDDPASWDAAYSEYVDLATSAGKQPLSRKEFDAWALETYGKTSPVDEQDEELL